MRAALPLALALAAFAGTPYETSVRDWRNHLEQSLKATGGWLSVAGLFWLKPGQNTAGSDPSSDIVLPNRAPARLGVFELHDGKVTFRANPAAQVLVNGKPATTAPLKSDVEGSPDVVQSGDLAMTVIQRGSRYGIRLRDPNSKMRQEFTGLHWYPVNGAYRVTAKFVPYGKDYKIPIPNILGQTEMEPSPGYVQFTLKGMTYRLTPVLEDDQLFFIFRDQTAGRTTYGAGRFLYSDLPKDGRVILDFNKAYNPPCAFTPYATCPLPPKQNRLKVSIEAGELKYRSH